MRVFRNLPSLNQFSQNLRRFLRLGSNFISYKWDFVGLQEAENNTVKVCLDMLWRQYWC
jgi:hypothetical protein